jgi:hypothetical protein
MSGRKTTRERREAKAERLRQWADSREAKADAAYAGVRSISDRIPMGQPILVGHHSEKRARRDQDRIERGMRQSVENGAKADEMRARADEIERQAKQSIYSDDADAIQQLEAKVAKLTARRDAWKVKNAEYRKAHRDELKAMSPYERGQAIPFPSYAITNLGATIRTAQKRIEQLQREKVNGPRDRIMFSRYAGACEDCGASIEKGQPIRYNRQQGARCESC